MRELLDLAGPGAILSLALMLLGHLIWPVWLLARHYRGGPYAMEQAAREAAATASTGPPAARAECALAAAAAARGGRRGDTALHLALVALTAVMLGLLLPALAAAPGPAALRGALAGALPEPGAAWNAVLPVARAAVRQGLMLAALVPQVFWILLVRATLRAERGGDALARAAYAATGAIEAHDGAPGALDALRDRVDADYAARWSGVAFCVTWAWYLVKGMFMRGLMLLGLTVLASIVADQAGALLVHLAGGEAAPAWVIHWGDDGLFAALCLAISLYAARNGRRQHLSFLKARGRRPFDPRPLEEAS
ncbi:MAG: DUF2628 domain-containing protein [Candidatus Krumholzibacteriota bacterium]|nr:DUF2628 domain-containing protein [Candidatus Krumholzibacteriota bacterium]